MMFKLKEAYHSSLASPTGFEPKLDQEGEQWKALYPSGDTALFLFMALAHPSQNIPQSAR